MALTDAGSGNGENEVGESDVVAKACVLDGFSDSAEVRSLIASLPEVHDDIARTECVMERFIGECICSVLFVSPFEIKSKFCCMQY